MIDHGSESPFLGSVQINVETTAGIEMYQEGRTGKSFLEILESLEFCFRRFIEGRSGMTFPGVTFGFLGNGFRKFRFPLLERIGTLSIAWDRRS